MSFPMINFKVTNAEVSDELKSVAESKLATLDKYIKDAPAICEVEFEKVTNHRQQGYIYRVEINLEVDGQFFRAEATAENFEKAIDDAREDLQQEMHTARGKRITKLMRGARKIKEMMRFGRKAV